MEILFDVLISLPFIGMFLLGLAVSLVVAWCYRSLGAGLTIIALGAVAEAMILDDIKFRLGIYIYMEDVTLGLVAVATILRFAFLADARPKVLPFKVFLVVFAVNLAHGLLVYGTAAGVAARMAFYALVACGYVMTFPMNEQRLRALFVAVVWSGLALLLLACYRGVAVALDLRDLLPPGGRFGPREDSVWRVISAWQSLAVAQAMLSLWAFAGLAPALSALRLLAPALLMAIVALQHRSVWVATLAGYATMRLGRASNRLYARQLLPVMALAVVLGLGIGLVGSRSGSGIGGDVARSARDAVELRGTAGARLDSWQQLVQKWFDSGLRGWAIGQPYGTRFERYENASPGAARISYEAHNYYVELLTTQGMLGLLSYLGMVASAVRGLWRTRAHSDYGLAARWLLVMLAFQLTYCLTYGVHYLLALSLGAALSLTAVRRGAAHPIAGRALAGGASLARRGR